MIEQIKKVWGNEQVLINNDIYCSKFLNLNSGYTCSLHYHAITDETLYVLCGTVEIKLINLENILPIVKPVLDSGEIIDIYNNALKNKDLIIKSLETITLNHGDKIRIKPFTLHSFISRSFAVKLLEVSTTHFEDDSYRITESRKLKRGE